MALINAPRGFIDFAGKGEKGDKGDVGATGATGAAGQKGDTGAQGIQGVQGLQGLQGIQGVQGETGAQGEAATVSVGTVTTGAAGSSAAVSNAGTTNAAVFNFTIPRGDAGTQGIKGDAGATGATGATGAAGADGADGADGAGVPVGGTAGQVLSKIDGANYNTQWATPSAGTDPSVWAAVQKNLLNILQLKLQQALASADIDAWSDLLADATLINEAASDSHPIDGVLSAVTEYTVANASSLAFGSSTQPRIAVGQVFTPDCNVTIIGLGFELRKYNSPSGNLYAQICNVSNGLPSTVIATSTNEIVASGLSTSVSWQKFIFNSVALNKDTPYAFVVRRTVPSSDSNYCGIGYSTPNVFDNGNLVQLSSSDIWSAALAADLVFRLYTNSAIIIWLPVAATEPLAGMAVVADQTLNAGAITWYLSDDGTNWTAANLDTMTSTGFDATSVYLKCVITGDATVSAVAYGGY